MGSEMCIRYSKSAVTFEHENWDRINSRWSEWRAKLVADQVCTPTTQQMAVIEYVHLRTKYEHFLDNNLPLHEDVRNMTPQPIFHLLHGLPGAGKSKVLQWLQSYQTM